MPKLFHPYLQLRNRTDRFVESVTARYADQIVCRAGCADCCQAGLTVTMVEAAIVGAALNLSTDRIFLQAGQTPLRTTGSCVLLDAKRHCRIYEARPLVCRTQGMPLLLPEATTISVCELNFIDMAPHQSAVLNTENLDAALFAANLDYCQKNGLSPMTRVPLDRLAQLAGIDIPKPT